MSDLAFLRKDPNVPLFQQVPQTFRREHDRLCWLGSKWAVSFRKCTMALTECGTDITCEMPDVIAWAVPNLCSWHSGR